MEDLNTQSIILWIYVALMAGGALLFYSWSRQPKGVPLYEYYIAMFIPVWSGLAYTAMALGQGSIEVAGQTTYYARYIDWVVTTPLLLLSLGLTAMFYMEKSKRPTGLLAVLIGADVVMITTGLLADLSEDPTLRFTWYGIGCVAMGVVLWIIWSALRKIAAASGPEHERTYTRLAGYLTLFWIAYPTVWMLGPSGLGILGQTTDTLLFVILPFFSKVGFSVFDLAALRKAEKAPLQNRSSGSVVIG